MISSFSVRGRSELDEYRSLNVMLRKEEWSIDCDEEVPVERNVPYDGVTIMSVTIVLDNITEEEESGSSCVSTKVWSEVEVNCEVRWMASSFNLPEEWNGMNLDCRLI